MSEANHTPGPWTLELNNHPDEIGDDNYSLFCNGYEFGKYNDESLACGFDATTPSANARLIAAAPDLLAACQEALVCLPDGMDDLVAQLNAAIKLATEGRGQP